MFVVSALIPKLALLTFKQQLLLKMRPCRISIVVQKTSLCCAFRDMLIFFSLLPPLSFGVKEPLQISANFHSWKNSTDSKV